MKFPVGRQPKLDWPALKHFSESYIYILLQIADVQLNMCARASLTIYEQENAPAPDTYTR